MGSPAIAAVIAQVAFWLLLVYGWWWEDIGLLGAGVFIALWACGFVGLPYVAPGAAMFPSYVALLDIVLVLMIFKGDVRLS